MSGLWRGVGLAPEALARVTLAGGDPVLPSSFRLATAAMAGIGAVGLAAAEIHRRRGGPAQGVTVEAGHALAEFRSEQLMRVDGAPLGDPWDAIAGAYRCGDGRWVRIHTNFPHHRDGFLRLLGAEYDRPAVARALEGWEAPGLEDAAAAAGLPAAMMRSSEEWDAHPQGRAVAALPVIEITRIGDAPPEPLPRLADRPLAGLRAVELTRIIAGPVCGRVLAAHGAEVMLVTGPHLPSIPSLVVDTGRGKRSTALDLRDESGRAALRGLVGGADLFIQGYRPGALATRGFGPEALAALRPGIICVSLSAYGRLGSWAGRRGFDSLVQTASGFNEAEAEAAGAPGQPKPLPCQALDHGAGYLMALGALAALTRRAEEGGSWHVQISLARTGLWIRGLGRVPGGLAAPAPGLEPGLMEDAATPFGRLSSVRHAALLERTPARWTSPPLPLGSDPPRWP
ncbi:CoA transferase [Pararoseomonas baculiformis]|uniref:CoA transferase n=1 Tax=Pararoseomonas baculiformis TaxID=2820812 RepID=UPI001FD7AC43|nr:CoA transferase [Pararoseomonas baculiformis]